MTPTQITLAIAFAIGLSVGGTGAWRWQSIRIAEKTLELTHERLDRANERIGLQQASRATADRLANQVITAQNAATTRATVLRRDAAGAAIAGTGLRTSSTDSVRAAAASLDACTTSLAAHSVVVSQCASRLVEVAGDADQWASQAVMLQDAWPK
jgi:hypothetical protein